MFAPRLFLRRTLGDISRYLIRLPQISQNHMCQETPFDKSPGSNIIKLFVEGEVGPHNYPSLNHPPWFTILGSPRIRESLSSVFMEITAAVRNNAAADQDSPHGVGEDTIGQRFSLGSPILKHPTFQRNIKKPKASMFW